MESKRKPCDPRLDELAAPSKRIVLNLYQEHAHHLDPERVEKLKLMVQEMYPMSPEQTVQYFADLKAKALALRRRRLRKLRVMRKQKARKDCLKRNKAYRKFKKLLIMFLWNAFNKKVSPPMFSERLRHLSDVVLEKLCKTMNFMVPKRDFVHLSYENFLITVSNWIAIHLNYLLYRIKQGE